MSKHVVVVGAVALGPKSAARFKRLEPGSRVTMLDKSELISYGGCGIPYFVSGEVSESMQLRTTSFHMLRDEKFFKEVKGIDVKTRCEATSIDRKAKTVAYTDLATGEPHELTYDKLVIATGSTPRRLGLPGEELEGVHYVSSINEASDIRDAVTKGEVSKAVIVGAGFIGLEMAEAFADMWGIETTVVEITDQIMCHYVSPDLAAMGMKHMEEKEVEFHLGETVRAIEGEDGRVTKVVTSKRTLEADMVVISAGVTPNGQLARAAGLEVSERGAVVVDEHMRTSDPDIFAGGDCVELKNMITGKPMYLPMGSMANRQGRVIGTNLAGGDAVFKGAVGAFAVKLFDTSLAGAGFSLSTARHMGFDAESVLIMQFDRAHFYPTKALMALELVVDRATRKVLGIQGFGEQGDAMVGKINVVAGLIPHGITAAELGNVEMAYAPPFSSALDILNALGHVAENLLDGTNDGISPLEFNRLWEAKDDGDYILDCREEPNARPFLERHPDRWHHIPQGEIYRRLDEIPGDKRLVLLCNTGARSYEAKITLTAAGYTDLINVFGGMASVKKTGLDI